MVEVIYDGGLGNYLFQYCFGRILAERLGYKLIAPPIPGFPRTLDSVDGRDYSAERILTLRGQKPDLSLLDHAAAAFHIRLTGYFQRYEYYRAHRRQIREWLATSDTIDFEARPSDVVLSIRRGRDYIPRYGLPLSYYENALASLEYDRVFICTNEPADPFIRFLVKKYGAILKAGTFQGGKKPPSYLADALDNFLFIKKFDKIIISNSSYPWWAAFLSDAHEIVFPRPSSGLWSPNHPHSKNISLEVDEARYEYLDCEAYESEFVGEVMRNRWDAMISGVKAGFKKMIPAHLQAAPAQPIDICFSEECSDHPQAPYTRQP